MRGENTMQVSCDYICRYSDYVWIAATIIHFHKNSTKNAGWATFSASLQNSQTDIRSLRSHDPDVYFHFTS